MSSRKHEKRERKGVRKRIKSYAKKKGISRTKAARKLVAKGRKNKKRGYNRFSKTVPKGSIRKFR